MAYSAGPAYGQFEQFFEEFFRSADAPEQQERLSRVEISYADEARFGRQAFEQSLEQLRQQGITVTDRGKEVKYLRALTAQLRPLMQNADRYRTIEVWVFDSEVTDARSFLGGWIIVSSGLLDFAESEAAIVGVLAHELAHIDRGHQLGLLRRWKLAEQTLTNRRSRPEDWIATGVSFASLFARPFRPEQEAEADADAVRWMTEIGYEPLELARLFEQWQERDGDRAALMPGFLRTHPLPLERREAVQREMLQAGGRRRAAPLYRGRENLKRRIPRSERSFRE
jgi:predicted Zn-dependent protease